MKQIITSWQKFSHTKILPLVKGPFISQTCAWLTWKMADLSPLIKLRLFPQDRSHPVIFLQTPQNYYLSKAKTEQLTKFHHLENLLNFQRL